MESSGLSSTVVRFIAQHIRSLDQLEILLLLRERRGEALSCTAVARELRILEDVALNRLTAFASQGLLTATEVDGKLHFRFDPANPLQETEVDALASTYRERRVAVITQIFSQPNDKVQTFADAFKFRKDD